MAETGSSIQAAPPRAIILPHGIYPIVMAVVGPCLRVPRFVSAFFHPGRRRKGSRMYPGFVLPSGQPCNAVPVVAAVFAGELFPSWAPACLWTHGIVFARQFLRCGYYAGRLICVYAISLRIVRFILWYAGFTGSSGIFDGKWNRDL